MASGSASSKVQTLIDKLKNLAVVEADMLSGAAPKQFFIEAYSAESLDELLKDFTPDDANNIWDKERQKPYPDTNTLTNARRAVAFMASGKSGVHRRYKENELTARIMGKSYLYMNSYFLGEAKHAMALNT